MDGRQELLEDIRNWVKPQLKVKAKDAMTRGVAEGPELGEVLAALETWWIDQDFPDDRARQLAELDSLIKARS